MAATTELVPLSKTEQKTFEAQKEIVTKGMHTFVEVGKALRTIRDGKLYREEHKTFEAFCKSTWDIGREYAHRLIEASGVTENLLPIGNILPATESQARPLAALDPEQQVEAWEQVVETAPTDDAGNPKITAAHVESVVEEFLEPEPAPKKTESVVLDSLDRQIPAALKKQHALAAEIQSTATKLDAVKKAIEGLVEQAGGEFIPFAEVLEGLKAVKGKIAQSRYWTDCPRCKGTKAQKTCDRCDGHGFIPFSRRGMLSAEDKAYLGIG